MNVHDGSEGLSRLVARLSESYPFTKVTKSLKNKQLEVVAPNGSHGWVLASLNQLRAQQSLHNQSLLVVSSGKEAEELVAFLRLVDPETEVLAAYGRRATRLDLQRRRSVSGWRLSIG